MNEHTPGPWRTARSPGYIIVDNGSKPSTVIAHAWSIDIHVPDEWKANARLIAAAPELYAATKAASEYYEMLEQTTGVEHPVLEQLRAALALVDKETR